MLRRMRRTINVDKDEKIYKDDIRQKYIHIQVARVPRLMQQEDEEEDCTEGLVCVEGTGKPFQK